jgi:hypothetical protein
MAQTQVFRGTARRYINDVANGEHEFFYHNTRIVYVMQDGSIQLNSGGWLTATTKLAMNQASNEHELGFSVFQRKGDWFVMWNGEALPFNDGMVLSQEN